MCSARRTLRGVPGSLTRRQLLVRTGGASVALVCFGALPGGALADPAALSSARAATYAALLDAINADPGYALADRATRRRASPRSTPPATITSARTPTPCSTSSPSARGTSRRSGHAHSSWRRRSRAREPAVPRAERHPHHRLHGLSHEHLPAQVHRHRADGGHHAGPATRQRLPQSPHQPWWPALRATTSHLRLWADWPSLQQVPASLPAPASRVARVAGRARPPDRRRARRRHEDHPAALPLSELGERHGGPRLRQRRRTATSSRRTASRG